MWYYRPLDRRETVQAQVGVVTPAKFLFLFLLFLHFSFNSFPFSYLFFPYFTFLFFSSFAIFRNFLLVQIIFPLNMQLSILWALFALEVHQKQSLQGLKEDSFTYVDMCVRIGDVTVLSHHFFALRKLLCRLCFLSLVY